MTQLRICGSVMLIKMGLSVVIRDSTPSILLQK